MQVIDFTRSYLRFRIDPRVKPAITVTRPMPTRELNVRIVLDCRCELRNRLTEERHEFVLTASCKTELVGAKRDLWMEPNADFCVVASHDEFLTLKSWAQCNMQVAKHPDVIGVPLERQSGSSRDAWAEFDYRCRLVQGRAVRSIHEISATIRSERPLVARIQYDDGPWTVTIDHPVKTFNYSETDDVYQTDTGPILLPELTRDRLEKSSRLIDCFDLAYSAFNSESWAEFIINVPTPIGNGKCVNHYSKTRRIEPAMNSLFELVDESQSSSRHVGADRGSRVDAAELQPAGNHLPKKFAYEGKTD
jgi:hypothetical protein